MPRPPPATATRATDVFPAPGHNHGPCQSTLIARANELFQARGLKMTELRRRVLEEIAGSHQALGAYDILERLAAKGPRLAPVSVYRAIEALAEAGLVHRLESRNAFFACHASHASDRDKVVLACEGCGRVAEIEGDKVYAALSQAIAAAGFQPRRTVTEVSGLCAACQSAPAPHDHQGGH
jgi:Fur family transcriptional regulator, zinc uptake regulator